VGRSLDHSPVVKDPPLSSRNEKPNSQRVTCNQMA